MIALSKKPDYEGENLEINEKEGKRKMLIKRSLMHGICIKITF